MYEEKKHTKTKIFLFLLFGILAVFLFVSIADFMIDMFSEIDKKSTEFKCADIDYAIEEVIYKEKTLTFLMVNNDYMTNISKITIKSDASENEYVLGLDSPLVGESSRVISLTNITIEKGFYTYVESCVTNRREHKI